MRSLRTRYEVALFWVPLGLCLIPSWVVGSSIHSYKQIPPALAPLDLFGGLVLIAGGIIGLYQPKRFDSWFQVTSPTLRGASQHLLSLVFGCWLTYWGMAAIVTGINRNLVA